ncbi:hypothetical protein WA026_023864 [Henosepilachna vigintioctopunctata]|uniref:Reverse transcriptase domain-containing protein n=1 Tax=Henosepilachna vigintioctopunctata TaxID=420089 RepID=A0AAW1UQB2_9CUCU
MLKILQWNIRSAIINIQNLKLLIEDHSPDLILLSETWLQNYQNLRIPGYYSLRCDRIGRGGGICFLVKRSLQFCPLSFSIVNTPDRFQYQAIKIGNMSVLHMYCPPDVNLSVTLLEHLLNSLTRPFIICGDLNAQSPSWGSGTVNRNGSILEEFLLGNDIFILNNGDPTRFTSPHVNQSVPDISLCSTDIGVGTEWEVWPDPCGSDHLPILLSIGNFNPHPKLSRFSSRKYNISLANWTQYQTSFQSLNCSGSVHNLETFKNAIVTATEASIPKRKAECLSKYKNPWWDAELVNTISKRREAFKEYLDCPSLTSYLKAKHLQAIAKFKIRQKKKISFINFCENISTSNGKNLWNDIRRFKTGISVPPSHKNIPSTCGQEILELLCSPDFSQLSVPTSYIPNFTQNEESLTPFTLDELVITLNSKKDTCPGKDGITFSMLKFLPIDMKQKFLIILNSLLENPIIHPSLKEIVILPFRKADKPVDDPLSYRPIALSSCILKTLESLLVTRLHRIMETQFSPRDLQFGFRRGKSINDALCFLISSMYNISLARNEVMIIVFLDLRHAYDSVEFCKLKMSLRGAKVPSAIIALLENLLLHRNAYLVDPSTGKLLGPKQMNRGLPQGSPISPVLFNLFVKDITNLIRSTGVQILQYADDTTVISTGSTIDSAHKKMSETLQLIEEWIQEKGLQISPNKSKAMILFFRCCDVNHGYKITKNLKPLPITFSIKSLNISLK